ncbi:hypothetical protein BDV40DRAFT_252173 [Aspergillus tamarii]|uniref:Uncharacterized protein n=1 Tax=Aspergillus tamarii TaxID=41984 RepID=A0A5N6VAA2_ASPTM|nr:hypothetical protein BDV40DRAFT_252173 [Aspergillus tamarii]
MAIDFETEYENQLINRHVVSKFSVLEGGAPKHLNGAPAPAWKLDRKYRLWIA